MPEYESLGNTTYLGSLILQIQAGGDEAEDARNRLIEESYRRFRLEASLRLRRDFPNVARAHETADVLHKTFYERIFKRDESGRDLLDREEFSDGKAFVDCVIKNTIWCLKDLARDWSREQCRRKEIQEAKQPRIRRNARSVVDEENQSAEAIPSEDALHPEAASSSNDTQSDRWAFMMEALNDLDEMNREAFEYTYFQELEANLTPLERKRTRQEVADFLHVDVKTVSKRRENAEMDLLRRWRARCNDLASGES